jgi:hypothetical protein
MEADITGLGVNRQVDLAFSTRGAGGRVPTTVKAPFADCHFVADW